MATTHIPGAAIQCVREFWGEQGERPDIWVAHLNRVGELFQLKPTQKLQLALTKLGGHACVWSNTCQAELATWPTFCDKLLKRFGERKEILWHTYDQLSQGDLTTQEYADQLAGLRVRLGLVADDAALFKFIRGLNPRWRVHVQAIMEKQREESSRAVRFIR